MDLFEVGGTDATLKSCTFALQALRFVFGAEERICFPEGRAANVLRGALGSVLRAMVCSPHCVCAGSCEGRRECPYARLFEPGFGGPSGLRNWPRPFVFRAYHLDGKALEAGATFHFDLHLFDLSGELHPPLIQAMAQLALEGLGVGRKRLAFVRVDFLAEDGSVAAAPTPHTIQLRLDRDAVPITRVRVRFVTPTELKSGSQLVREPEFGVLAARVRDRICSLNECYAGGAPEIDFKRFGERAAQVRMTSCDVQTIRAERRSSRTGQIHSLGGFVGSAEYAGDLTEFMPWLRAACWTGVGRQTVWGKGMMEIDVF